jgi:hypothetical protein
MHIWIIKKKKKKKGDREGEGGGGRDAQTMSADMNKWINKQTKKPSEMLFLWEASRNTNQRENSRCQFLTVYYLGTYAPWVGCGTELISLKVCSAPYYKFFFNLFIYFYCCAGVCCGIYKSSQNM